MDGLRDIFLVSFSCQIILFVPIPLIAFPVASLSFHVYLYKLLVLSLAFLNARCNPIDLLSTLFPQKFAPIAVLQNGTLKHCRVSPSVPPLRLLRDADHHICRSLNVRHHDPSHRPSLCIIILLHRLLQRNNLRQRRHPRPRFRNNGVPFSLYLF